MKLTLFSVIVTYQLVQVLSCKSKVNHPTQQEAIQVWDYYEKHYYKGKKHTPGKYRNVVSDADKARYGQWLLHYVYNRMQASHPQVMAEPLISEWYGWDHGEEGVDPPPWAFNINSHNKQLHCLYNFEYGDCQIDDIRWGFDPRLGRCVTFKYSGCGGNSNNYMNEKDCDATCGSKAFERFRGCINNTFTDEE